MKAAVLIDNVPGEGLAGEWGLSLWIEHGDKRILFDTGATGAFAENAERLGIDLASADFAALSHAHYDHAGGMAEFFARNSRAPMFVRAGAGEDCFKRGEDGPEYIGIERGALERYAARIRFVSGLFEVCHGAWLLPHGAPHPERADELLRLEGGGLRPDGFLHEQSLVVADPRGLVVFSSCSHAGADVVLAETARAFPGERIYAFVGGLHLYRSPREEIEALAARVLETGVSRVVTGHCTGEAAALLRETLGDRLELFCSGYRI
ncbi:MAG: MBL fold metallo-hydrolase [Oscillospiraceae bacterium]|nr:MBL fold metallo-hydrolase [Oscillospiraceae bacterium]